MPCDTIRATPIVFENAVFKAAHKDVLINALLNLKFIVKEDAKVKGLTIYPAIDRYATPKNTVTYWDGQFKIPSTMKDRFSMEKIQNAYGMQAARVMAQKAGWQFKQLDDSNFQIVRNT
jgi:hypothetical protein